MTSLPIHGLNETVLELAYDFILAVPTVYDPKTDLYARVVEITGGRWALMFPGTENLYYLRNNYGKLQIFYGDNLLGEADFDGVF